MSVTETLRGLGGWTLTLRNAPAELLDSLKYYGHIAIHTGRVDYRVTGDAALTSSRYTGVLRKKSLYENENDETITEIGGPGMAMWLGDEDHKGEVIETPVVFNNETFENTIRGLLPDSVVEGTLFNIGETYSGTFVYVSPREAINYVTETLGAEWVVRGNGELDAGLESDLFVVNPKTIISRKQSGVDMTLAGLLGNAKTDQDVEDFTTRVVLLANGEGGSVPTADADINPGLNPYKDLHGNFVKFTRLVSESSTDATNAEARAQLQLNRFSDTRDAMTLDSSEYDIKGNLSVGDYMWVHDPEIDLVDNANQQIFRGKRINPIKLRLTEMTWPVSGKFSVGYRDWAGKWFNLTDYVVRETGESTLVVGGYNRSLTGDGGVVGPRPQPDTSVPAQTVFVEPFTMSVYQSPINGETKAQVNLKWLKPDNTDGSTILDGSHYEIRWRNATTPLFPIKHAQLHAYKYAELEGHPHYALIQYPVTGWSHATAPFSELTFLLQELVPSMPYEVQIRAVDAASPPNVGAWSDVALFQTSADTLPPAVPAPPAVSASKMAIQLVHTLGRADGGTFNLDLDLHHLDVHGSYEPNFEPSDFTLIGKMHANSGNITGQVAVVATFHIENLFPTYFKVVAVDITGNKSEPSSAVQTTAELIDDAHISSLTVSKVTAGTISADWILGATIKTGLTGARVEQSASGIRAYNYLNNQTFSVDSATGDTRSDGNFHIGGNVELQGAVRTYGSFGEVVTELGILSDGTYGLALRNSSNQLLKLSDFVFGPQTAFVAAFEPCFNPAFTDLATFGPAVTVYIGPTGRAMMITSCFIAAIHSAGYSTPEITGATYRAPTGGVGAGVNGGPINVGSSCSHVHFVEGLNEGWHTFTLKYNRTDYAVPPDVPDTKFGNRRITVLPY